MRELQRVIGILLDEEDRHALAPVELADGIEDLPHDDGREAERRLVEHEETRPAHERAGDRQHLLLAARKRAAALCKALLEPGKELCHTRQVLLEMSRAINLGAHLEIFQHRHAPEDAPPFRRLRDPEARDRVCFEPRDVLAGEADRSLSRPRIAADGHHQRRLAGAIGTDQRHDLAFRDLDIDTLQRHDAAVVALDAADAEKGRAHGSSPRSTAATSSSSTPR